MFPPSRVAGQLRQEQCPRFTRDGSDELESCLARTCDHVRNGVQRIIPEAKLEAILLGGGYGRGEGGVLMTAYGDRPYNDLEFYICVRGNRVVSDWRYARALHQLAHRLSPLAGVEIEFKIISIAHLRRSPVTMFYYDLAMGHRWLLGDETLLRGCEHHCIASDIPLSEATRLLMNRCSGLLFARRKLETPRFTLDDADFVGRNLAKAQLAFGDVVLAAVGQYDWSCLERRERLQHLTTPLPRLAEIHRHHAAGVKFKLHPRRTCDPATVLRLRCEELCGLGLLVWLWLESRRLGVPFQSARHYGMSPVDKCPETKPWRNFLVNVKAFGPPAVFTKKSMRCPRMTLLNTLPLLLWEPWRRDPQLTQHLRQELQARRAAPQDLPDGYRRLWSQFN
jgi:hypothetical protein